jgi:nicotinate-nucleotide adenylyltransferase
MIKLPKTRDNARVGILGGSFDPPHLGHQILALCALALEDIDQLWVIPCADHPFSKKLSSFEHRMEMCQLAFSFAGSNIEVVGIENELSGPSYTVKTLEAIREAQPKLELSFIMGSDVYLDLPKWQEPQNLAALARLVVFLRQGTELSDLTKVGFEAEIHDAFVLPHVKSTLIRESIRNNQTQTAFVDRRVLSYVIENALY